MKKNEVYVKGVGIVELEDETPSKENISIIDLFDSDNVTQSSKDKYKTTCPCCGLQGNRTQGFILFKENNCAYCHTTTKNFSLLETYALKKGIISCMDGRDTGEKKNVLTGDLFKETLEHLREDYDKDFYNKLIKQLNITPPIDTFLIPTISKKTGEIISNKVDIDEVAKYIENKYDIRNVCGLKEEKLEVYQDGIWTPAGSIIVKAEAEKLLSVYSKNNIVKEIVEKIKRRTKISIEEAEKIPEYMRAVNNGVLNLKNVDNIEFLEHSKDYNFKTKWIMDYNPKSKCPNILKFINTTFRKQDIPLVQEWFGFHLVKRYFIKSFLIAYGPKNTGKSVFVNLLIAFISKNNSGLSLQEISVGKPFDLCVLKDMDANICDDLPSTNMKIVGGVKKCVGDGYINGEYKFGDKINFRNSAKQTHTCNKIPSSGEDIDDDAYYDRILLLPIDNILPKEKQDENLIDSLSTLEELSGLLNWALEGYVRLRKQKRFTNKKEAEEVKFLMIQNGDSLARFVTETLKYEPGKKIDKQTLYEIYCGWCMQHTPKLSPDSKEMLGRNLIKNAPYIQATSDGKVRYWSNVSTINDTYTYYTFKNNIRKYNDNEICNKNILYNISKSVISVSDKTTKKTKKSPKITTEIKDSKVQFWDAKECKKITTKCTKEEVLEFIKNNPGIDCKELYLKFKTGCMKFKSQLIKENKIILKENKLYLVEDGKE